VYRQRMLDALGIDWMSFALGMFAGALMIALIRR
jgi:hypothetical protein